MTKQELKDIILSAKTPNWFDNISMNLDFKTIGVQQNLNGFSSIYLYFQTQVDGWEDFEERVPQVLQSSINFFNTVFPILKQIASIAKESDENQLNSIWHNVNNALNRIQIKNTFTYDCLETEYLIKINESQPEFVNEIHTFLIAFANNQGIQPTTPKSFTGYLLAYEFIQKDHTKLVERRNSEKLSLNRLRNDFQKYLVSSEEQLNEFLKQSKQKSEDYANAIDKLKETKENDFDAWYSEAKDTHVGFVSETKEHRLELEKTYRELLRLKEPADYWKMRAAKLQSQGRRYINLLIVLIIFSAGLLFILLGTISNGALEAIFNDVGKAVKWSIVFVSFLSFLAYGARLLAKVIFSSFHLARDAEEREHLTYLYLSLHKDGNIETIDRQLVLQALFSRADTGLLKDDSSPSMPGSATSFIEKVMTKPG